MLSNQNVKNMIHDITVILNGYLINHPHELLTGKELQKGYTVGMFFTKTHRDYVYFIDCEDGNYIAFRNKLSRRDTKLTLERMKNVYTIKKELLDCFTKLAGVPDSTAEQKNEQNSNNDKVLKIRSILDKGIDLNTILSLRFNKKHRSKNREDGTTKGRPWQTESTAEETFRDALTLLNDTAQASLILPPPYKSEPAAISLDSVNMITPLPAKTIDELQYAPEVSTQTQPRAANSLYPSVDVFFKPAAKQSAPEFYKPSAPPSAPMQYA